jgi:glutathione S-transferase
LRNFGNAGFFFTNNQEFNMLTLYFSPGACSMASHIGIEESGAPYTEKPTLLSKQEHKTEAYLKINPRGKVPALDVDGRVITENTAILTYLARQYPQAQLMPADPVEAAQCIETMAWLSNIVHPSYQRTMRPERFADSDAGKAEVVAAAKKAFWANLQEIDAMLAGREWIVGDRFSVADGYALVFYGWGARSGYPVNDLVNYTAWKDRMLKRPAVMKVLQSEQNVLVKP